MNLEQVISLRLPDGTSYEEDPLFEEIKPRLISLVGGILKEIENRAASYLKLPFENADLRCLQEPADRIRQNFTDVVVLGVGGSSLGAQALYALSNSNKTASSSYPKLHFQDNLNVHSMSVLLDSLDFGTAHFIAISKSGNTAETMAQTALCLAKARASLVEAEFPKHFSVIVGPGDNALRRLAELNNFAIFDHLDDLCGRFSVFSNVGLLPAMIAGIDVDAARRGARDVLDALAGEDDVFKVPAVMGAAMNEYLTTKYGIGINVMMPYDTRLDSFSRWYQQLWAESLGKNGKGTTPLRALGPADQHSQLQLFLDGPGDKFHTMIVVDTAGKGPKIPAEFGDLKGLRYLVGRTVGDIVAAQAYATIQSLIECGRPVREIRIPELNERTIGSLMMSFMIETVLTAGLNGVDAFNQPAVEESKRLTIDYLEVDKPKK
jgi:glucose-6-phosphate isomerase